MSLFINILTIILRIITFPIFYVKDIITVALSKTMKPLIKIIIVFVETVCLVFWFIVVAMFLDTPPLELMMQVISPTPILVETDLVEYDPSNFTSYSGGTTGSGTLNINYSGGILNVDMSRVDENTVINLPAGTYEKGSALQRIQLLYLIEEICARPEITCTPEELLGFYYSECTGYIPTTSKNLLKTTWTVEYNSSGCGGPFQYQKDAWAGTEEYRGKAFISKLEDPTLSDSLRVQTSDTCKLSINGLKRPSMFYFPDAAYSAAYRISLHKDISNSRFHWTGDMYTWGKQLGMSNEQTNNLKTISAGGYYNGYTQSVKSFIPPMYMDIQKSNNGLSVWSNLASSRESLNNKLRELANSTKRTYPNFTDATTYYENYGTSLANGIWQSSQFSFMVFNGGKYIYDGLKMLASQLPQTNTSVTLDPSQYSDGLKKVIAWAEQWVGKTHFRHKDGTMCESKNWCARFLWNAYYAGNGGNYRGGDAETAPHVNSMPSDYSTIPAGACIVSQGSGGYAGHVGLCVGNGYMIEAGGDKVQKVKISESYGKGKFLGWGMPYDFGMATSNSSEDFAKLYTVIKSCYGKPYVSGGSGPNYFDCSGFVYYCFKTSGLKNWTRTSADGMWTTQVTKIEKGQIQPGDLIFYTPWGEPTSTRAGHVAIYIGNGKAAHAPQEGDVVKEFDSSYEHKKQKILGYGRVK